MFFTYLFRELSNRRRQTTIVAVGLALAIALVIVVNAVAAGMRDAQSDVLATVYGVGTDVTVTKTPATPEEGEGPRGPQFQFGSDEGATADGSTTLSRSVLSAGPGNPTMDGSVVDTARGTDGVAAAAGYLSLTNTTLNGELPAPPTGEEGERPNQGGGATFGGGDFDVATFSVIGLDPTATIGPLAATEVVDGRLLESSDSGELVALIDEAYATSESLAVGDIITVGESEVEVVGIVASTSQDATTPANVYLPLETAQTLAGLDGQVSTVAVQAESADQVETVAAELEEALPNSTVSTQADLASSITGSLSSAAGLIANLGTWLSILVLAAAFLLAILLTISGVTRRTREFGTLKAIGWTNGRVVRQVAGESFVQGIIGGAIGVAVGLGGILLVNLIAPTFSATTSTSSGPAGLIGGGPAGPEDGSLPGGGGGPTGAATSGATTEVALQAPITISVILIAVALAVLGGLLAGVIGGWRAARLRPAEALRSAA